MALGRVNYGSKLVKVEFKTGKKVKIEDRIEIENTESKRYTSVKLI